MKDSVWIKLNVCADTETILSKIAEIKAHVEAIEKIAGKLVINTLTDIEVSQTDDEK